MYNNREYRYYYITGLGTVQVFSGKGVLHSVVVNGIGTGGTIKIVDGLSGSTANIGTITLTSSPVATFLYDVSVSTGLRISTSGSPDITVTYTVG